MTVRTVECKTCGEGGAYDSWPYEGPDDEDVLDGLMREDGWVFEGGDEFCADHDPNGER